MQVCAMSPMTMSWWMPCFLSCRSRSVLAKPLEHQCSVATISPGLGSNPRRMSPPQVPYSKLFRIHALLSELAQYTSRSRSRRDGIDDAVHRKRKALPLALRLRLATYWEHSCSLHERPLCRPISCPPPK